MPISDLIENFNAPTMDSAKWALGTTWRTVNAGVTVSQATGQLVITPLASAPAGEQYRGYVSVNTFDLTNSGIYVKLVQTPVVAQVVAQFTVALDRDNTINWYQIGTDINADSVFAASYTASYNAPYVPSTHLWLRIRHTAGTIEWHSSAVDPPTVEGDWTLRGSRALSGMAITALKVDLIAGTGATTASPGVVIFDNLNTIGGPPIYTQSAYRFRAPTGSLYAPP
jgi:hypothetical protein